MADGKSFDFVDVNPGVPGMTFAAEAEGGVCVGVVGLRPSEATAHEEYFGRGSAQPPLTDADIILVGLPFSMFARAENCDPAVSAVIESSFRLAKEKTPVLFRVTWSAARRMGVEAEEYRSAVEARFGSKKWEVTSSVSNDGRDMFVCAVPRARWGGVDPLPSDFPVSVKPRARSNPQEILVTLGYPAKFALLNARLDRMVVEGAVVISNARAAIVGALGSVR